MKAYIRSSKVFRALYKGKLSEHICYNFREEEEGDEWAGRRREGQRK